MKIRYPLAISAALLLSACGPAQVDKVCAINVKTEKSINGNDLKPTTESKTMVLTINEKSKAVSFNGQLFTTPKDASFYEGMVYGDKKTESSAGPFKNLTSFSLKYQIATGVIDYVETNKFLQTQAKHYEYEQVTYNGVCK